MIDTLRAYYWLVKPGIIYGNLLAAAAGFFIGSSGGSVDWVLLLETGLSIALIIASACVINNYIDRDIDRVMARTKYRALANRKIPARNALILAAVLGVSGFTALAVFCNSVTFLIGLIAFVDYVVLYGWTKRRTWHGTLVGTISGSAPLVAGYTSAADLFDIGAALLFLMMAFWQMPHFYAIAMRRLKDYKAAGLPVLPAVKGMEAAKAQIIGYIAAFIAADILLYALGYFGRLSTVVIGVYGAIWLSAGVKGLSANDDKLWAKRMFLYSLVFLPLLSAVSLIDVWL